MIFTERTVTVTNDNATINKPLILYRGDKNIELKITIAESQFKFRNTDASNVIETTDASYAQLVINTPYNSPIFSDVAATKNGAVIFVITEAMIDEIREVGAYEIQIRLLDDNKQSRASIPPVSNAIEIREPIAIEDGSAVDSNAVNVAKVNRALTTTSAPLEAFDSQGNYIKKTWGDGDPITDAALNKMEAGIDGVNKKVANNSSQIKDNMNYIYKQKSTYSGILKKDGIFTILAGIDSLSNGAGGSNYGEFMTPKLYNKYGFGGYGYVGFQNTTIQAIGGWNVSGFTSIENLDQSLVPSKYSFDNKGMYGENISNGNIYYYFKDTKQKKCKVIYLKQPNGGTFKTNWIGSKVSYNVDTSSDTYDLGTFELTETNTGAFTGISLKECTGKLCVFGVYLYNDEGAIFTIIGKGGDRLANHAKTDDDFRKKWLDIINPDIYLFNGGANDKDTFTADTYSTALSKYIQPFIDKGVHLVCIRPNAIQNNTSWDNIFNPILYNYCTQNGLDYISDKLLLGNTYDEANKNGYMLDGIHPNKLGNKKRANNYLNFLGIEQIVVKSSDSSQAVIIPQYKQQLSPKRISVSGGGTTQVYNLGMVAGYPNALLCIDIYGGRNATHWNMHKKVYMSFKNRTANNQITAVSDLIISDQYHPDHSNNFTVEANITDNKLVISITENGDGNALNLYVEGYGVLTTGNVMSNGLWLTENEIS